MKWHERPSSITEFWEQNKNSIKSYEKEFDWENRTIEYTIIFVDKSKHVFNYSFDGVKPEGYT